MPKLDNVSAVTVVTDDDYFLIRDDTTLLSRKVKWENIEASIKFSEITQDAAAAIDGGVYASS